MPVPTQGPILDAPSEAEESISTNQQIEVMQYIEEQLPVCTGMIDATSSAQRIFMQIANGNINPVMIRTLIDELSAISVAADELFGDVYDIVHPEDDEEETVLTGPEDCGRGFSMAKCIESACTSKCEIPQRR